MQSLTIAIPESLKEFIDRQIAEGNYDSADNFISGLILEAQKEKAREKVDALLIEGLDSGPATPMTRQDWEDLRQTLRRRLDLRDAS